MPEDLRTNATNTPSGPPKEITQENKPNFSEVSSEEQKPTGPGVRSFFVCNKIKITIPEN